MIPIALVYLNQIIRQSLALVTEQDNLLRVPILMVNMGNPFQAQATLRPIPPMDLLTRHRRRQILIHLLALMEHLILP